MALENQYNIKLYPCLNGWVEAVDSGDDGSEIHEKFYVYEKKEGEDLAEDRLNECKAMKSLLYAVMEELFFYNNKHNAYNLRIYLVDKTENIVE